MLLRGFSKAAHEHVLVFAVPINAFINPWLSATLMALQTVFMSGLTLAYCLWISPEEIFDITTSNGIHDCSIVLFVIAERVPAAKKYRNAFKVIRQRVIDRIPAMGPAERRSRERVPGLRAELAASGSFPFESNVQYEIEGHFGVDKETLDQLSHVLTDIASDYNVALLRSPS